MLAMTGCLASAGAHADWRESLNNAWDATREATGKIVEATRSKLSTSDPAPADPNENNPSTASPNSVTIKNWPDLADKLTQGIDVLRQIETAPESSFFKSDKAELQDKFNTILDKTIVLLENTSLRELSDTIEALKNKIADAEQSIMAWQEAKISAPITHAVKTTQAEYDDKIAAKRIEIQAYEDQIQQIETDLGRQLRDIGVNLNADQLAVLLSRVDGDDIIQMAGVFDSLKQVTGQLMELTRKSEENLGYAKKYYGMHMVLLELAAHIQSRYIAAIDQDYLPRLDGIIQDTRALKQISTRHLQQEKNDFRRGVYRKNIQAQDLTLKTAQLYVDNLKDQQQQVQAARSLVLKDLQLATNTYETVKISAELMTLLKNGADAFQMVMAMQTPDIVPFENLTMQQEYQALSRMLSAEGK